MSMNPNVVELDPNDQRDVYWEVVGDTIASAIWSSAVISPAGTPALTISAPTNTTTRSTVRVSGIALGAKHYLTCKLTLTSGQVIERSRVVYGAEQ